MKKYTVITIGVLALICFGILATNRNDTKSEITIGTILNLTGSFASMGENSKNGIDLAVREINEKGGIMGRKVVIDYQDNNGDNPKGALDALYKLTSKDVRLIVGPDLTPSGNAVAPIAGKANVMMISPSIGSESFNTVSDRAFSVYPTSKFESFMLAEYLYNERGYRRIAIFGSKQEWENNQAQFIKEKFEDLGGTVTSIQTPMVDNKDLRAESLKIKQSGPEAVVFTNFGETGLASKRLREIGVTQPFYSIIINQPQIAVSQGAMEGMIFESTDTTSPDFEKKFKESYKKDPSFPASQAYDAVYMFASAIEKSKSTDPEVIAKTFSKIKEFEGASGKVTFDENRNAHKKVHYYQIRNGAITPLEK